MRQRAGAGLVVAIAVLLLAGCGGSSGDPAGQHIAAYLRAVNHVERALDAPLNSVDAINRQLATRTGVKGVWRGPAPSAPVTAAAQRRALHADELKIVGVGRRLRAIPVPRPARSLRGLLISLLDRQAQLTEQTRRLAGFIPGFTRSLRPLGPALVRLERVLSVTGASGSSAVQVVYGKKIASLHEFDQTLSGIITSLRRLTPPASSVPTARAELGSLAGMRSASTVLARDLAAGRTSGLTGVLQAFERAAARPGSAPAQRAERAAILDYNRQVRQLGQLVVAADRERLRLAQRYS